MDQVLERAGRSNDAGARTNRVTGMPRASIRSRIGSVDRSELAPFRWGLVPIPGAARGVREEQVAFPFARGML